MGFAEAELKQPARSRFDVTTIGGDAIFLLDRRTGHKLYMGQEKRLAPMEQRRYFASLSHDLRMLTVEEFSNRYGLVG